jgi:hypothetical protein
MDNKECLLETRGGALELIKGPPGVGSQEDFEPHGYFGAFSLSVTNPQDPGGANFVGWL